MTIYLDNAATSWPKPETVYEALGNFLREAGANPGRSSHRMAANAAAAVGATRVALARLLNAESAERVTFAANATDALNTAMRGWVRPGDRVVTTTMEHNSIRRPLRRAEQLGAEIVRLEPPCTGLVDLDQVESAAKGARLIALSQASNVNGVVQPIAEIGAIARRAGALLLVDGAQSVGAMPVDVQALQIDLLAFPGHKALLGPPGTGGLYIGPRVPLADLEPLRSGGTGVDSASDEQPATLPFRYEAGTLNTVGIAALGAGVAHVVATGIPAIAAHHLELTRRLLRGLARIAGVRVYDPCQTAPAAVVSFTIAGWLPADAGAVLDQSFAIACRTGLHCAPDACRTIGAPAQGTIRFSPGLMTTVDEIETALAAVRELAANPLEGMADRG